MIFRSEKYNVQDLLNKDYPSDFEFAHIRDIVVYFIGEIHDYGVSDSGHHIVRIDDDSRLYVEVSEPVILFFEG